MTLAKQRYRDDLSDPSEDIASSINVIWERTPKITPTEQYGKTPKMGNFGQSAKGGQNLEIGHFFGRTLKGYKIVTTSRVLA